MAKFSSVRVGVYEGANRGEVFCPATCEGQYWAAQWHSPRPLCVCMTTFGPDDESYVWVNVSTSVIFN